jgi:RND family efflux transporter MFP subunit
MASMQRNRISTTSAGVDNLRGLSLGQLKSSHECPTNRVEVQEAPGYSREKRLIFLLLAILTFTLGLVGCAQSKASIQLPPPEVLVASPVQRDVPVYSEWVATLDGYTNAEIRPHVSGYVTQQNYKEGSVVRKGQVLFEIDPRQFQAALDQAKGELATAQGSVARSRAELSRAKAQLAEAQAALGKATIDVDRDTPLVTQRAVAKEKLDTEVQAKKATQASVESAQAAIQSAQAGIQAAQAQVVADQAAVERAELDLGWTKVTSLVDGIAGIAQVQIGNLVSPNTQLTDVSQVDPIKVYFPVSEQEYLRAKRASGQPIELFESSPELILADGTVYPRRGKIVITGREIDPATGTIRLVAAFPNPGNILRPGGYGRVRIQTSIKKNALLVPQSAVKEIQGGYEVALVTSDKKATIRPVRAAEKVGTMWVIDDGLKLDEQVVVEGIANLKDGIPVAPKPAKIQAEGR